MNAPETLALAKIIKEEVEKAARKVVRIEKGGQPVEYPIDLTVRVQANVKVFADTEKTPTVNIPYTKVFSAFLDMMNANTIADRVRILTAVFTKALNTGNATGNHHGLTGQQFDAEMIVKESSAAAIQAMIGSLPKVPQSGQVRVNDLEITEIVLLAQAA